MWRVLWKETSVVLFCAVISHCFCASHIACSALCVEGSVFTAMTVSLTIWDSRIRTYDRIQSTKRKLRSRHPRTHAISYPRAHPYSRPTRAHIRRRQAWTPADGQAFYERQRQQNLAGASGGGASTHPVYNSTWHGSNTTYNGYVWGQTRPLCCPLCQVCTRAKHQLDASLSADGLV